MSIFGKVLIFLNLLAAGAFTYLTIQDWKLRQELQWAAFRGQSLQDGLPLDAAEKPPADLDDRVAFSKKVGAVEYTSIPKARLADICPPGDEGYGGPAVATQTAEMTRLKDKLLAALPGIEANQGGDRLRAIQTYLMNLARTGADRDGVNALLDVFDTSKKSAARRDLPFLARTSSQIEALRTLIDVLDLGDPQAVADEASRASRVTAARESVKRFALGQVPFGAAGTDADELRRVLVNLLGPPIGADKDAVKAKATADPTGFAFIADVAANPLATRANVDEAAKSLSDYAAGKALTAPEKASLAAVDALIRHPAEVPYTVAMVDTAATALLTEKFEDAAAPVAKDGPDSYGGKARKIAHLLYHIDAHRHLSAKPDDVSARQAWHQRVAWVVGLPLYVQVAEAQASEYAEAATRLVSLITDEESAFRDQYNALVQRIRVLHSRWETVDAEFQAQTKITDENVRLKNERLTERDNLKKELAKAETDAAEALARLKDTQGRLFVIQKQLRDAQEAILNLERELRRRELGS